jgi:hypothetical protein
MSVITIVTLSPSLGGVVDDKASADLFHINVT